MASLRRFFQKGSAKADQSLFELEIETGLERRKKFLGHLNRGWLVLGIVTLVSLPFYPKQREEFIFLLSAIIPTYLIVHLLNRSGRTWWAGVVFTLCVNFSFFGLFINFVSQLGATEAFNTQATVWMLMGLAVIFAGIFVDKWAAPGLAAFNGLLFIVTRLLIAPGSDPRPSIVVLWAMLALTSWLFEHTLDQAMVKVQSEFTERERAEQEIRNRMETITALYETTRDLVIEHDLTKLLQIIVERAARMLQAEGGGLYLCEPELKRVRCVVSYNTQRDFTGTVLKYGEGAAGRVALTKKPLIIDNYNSWEGRAEIYETEKPFQAVLSVPIKWQNEVIGVIHVLEFQKEHFFTANDLDLLTSFANQAATALQNARMYGLVQKELVERKAAEAAQLESEQRFRGLSEAAFEGIMIHDKGVIQDANQVFADMIGIHDPKDLIGKNGLEILPFTPESLRRLRESLGSGLTKPIEITVIRPDGSMYTAETQGRDINYKGRILRVVAMRDISERKLAEEQLRKLSLAVEQSPTSIVITNKSGEIEYVNPQFTQITGYTLKEAIGNNPRILKSGYMHPEEYKQMWDTILTGKSWRGEFYNRKKNGDFYWENAVISSISNDRGEITHFIAVKEDVTERKQAEDAHRESEVRYRSLFENMLEGYSYCKMIFAENMAQDFRYLDVNPAFEELTGLKNVIGHRVSRIIPDIKTSNPELLEIYGRVALTGKPEKFETYVPALKKWFSVSVFSPAVEYFVAVFDNITERKHYEDELQKLNIELEAHVSQRTAQLETANKELEAFSYSISHDLRAPLRAIDGFSSILASDFAEILNPEVQDLIKNIREGALKMEQLIDDILRFSQLSRHSLQNQHTEMKRLAEESFQSLINNYPNLKVDFRLGDLPDVNADPALIRQVFINLLENALKYSSKREMVQIEVNFMESEGETVYFIRDNGAGFDMQYADKLFGAFQRLHSSEEFEGTGIGLAIVSQIISRHAGRVWAESEVNKGATFYFTLG